MKIVLGYLAIGLLLFCIVAVDLSYECEPAHMKDDRILIGGAAVTLFWPAALAVGLVGSRKHAPFSCDTYK